MRKQEANIHRFTRRKAAQIKTGAPLSNMQLKKAKKAYELRDRRIQITPQILRWLHQPAKLFFGQMLDIFLASGIIYLTLISGHWLDLQLAQMLPGTTKEIGFLLKTLFEMLTVVSTFRYVFKRMLQDS